MFFKKYGRILILALLSAFIFAVCQEDDNGGVTVKPATVTFWNTSSYKVDIYKNLNPEYFDPTTLVCTLNAGESKAVEQYPSYDQLIGDAFYPRYNVLLANSLQTGTTDIYADAERVLSNMTFVIESGKTYTKTIVNPANDLNFINGYIIVRNHENSQIQITRGSTILHRKDNDAVHINASGTAYYEIAFTYLDGSSITMNQLSAALSDRNIPFPSFGLEKGKTYTFTVQNGEVAGPVTENILR